MFQPGTLVLVDIEISEKNEGVNLHEKRWGIVKEDNGESITLIDKRNVLKEKARPLCSDCAERPRDEIINLGFFEIIGNMGEMILGLQKMVAELQQKIAKLQ